MTILIKDIEDASLPCSRELAMKALRTNKRFVMYKILEMDVVNPLTDEPNLPPPVSIPGTYNLQDQYEKDPTKRNKLIKHVTSTEWTPDPRTGEQIQKEIVLDVDFIGGYKTVLVDRDFNTFVFMQLNPYNTSNKFRPKELPGIFERGDKMVRSVVDRLALDDLSLEAGFVLKGLGWIEIKEYAASIGVTVHDREVIEVKMEMREIAKSDPRRILEMSKDEDLILKLDILDAKMDELLYWNRDKRLWIYGEDESQICETAVGADPDEELRTFLSSKDGKPMYAKLKGNISPELEPEVV